jgi:hypothetical protein
MKENSYKASHFTMKVPTWLEKKQIFYRYCFSALLYNMSLRMPKKARREGLALIGRISFWCTFVMLLH